MRAGATLLALAFLAGCAQPFPVAPGPPTAAPAQSFTYAGNGCDGYLLALFVDAARTDPYLPPGFHLRDPSDFFPETRVATGQALVILAAVLCGSATLGNGTFQEAFAGIFVLPPAVAGDRPPAKYDFYEVDHFAPPGPLRKALAAWAWPVTAANLTAQPTALQGNPVEFTLRGDGPPLLFAFTAATPAPRDYGLSLVRLWHDGAAGIARIDYALPLDFGFGSGTCTLPPRTHLAALVGQCPDPVMAARQAFPLPATAVLEPGRHAL